MFHNYQKDEYIECLRKLVNVDCGSRTPAGIEKIADILTPYFQSIGFTVRRHHLDAKAGPCLEITNREDAQQYDVMLCGHMDTVFAEGTVAERPMSDDGVKIYGPGVADMKSGILNMLYALGSLEPAERDNLSILVALNCDEEIGSIYSREWLENLARKSRVVLVCEAARANGNLVRSRKGNAKYELTFHGKASHAGVDLQSGVSAIYELAQWSLAIKNMVNFETGTTLNVGVIQGGSAVNVVPDHAKAIVDLRFWNTEEAERIHEQLLKMAETPFESGARVDVNRQAFKPAMNCTPDSQRIIEFISEEAQVLNIIHGWADAGGGSDGNFTAAIGTPTVDGLGPIGAGMHSTDEFLLIESIAPRIQLLTNTLRRLGQQ